MIALATMGLAGGMFWTPETSGSIRKSRELAQAYAKCVVQRRPDDAAAAVLSVGDNKKIFKDFPKLLEPDCLADTTDSMMFPGDILRYALAEALVKRDLSSQPLLQPASIAPLQHRDPGTPPKQVDETMDSATKKALNRQWYDFGMAVMYSQVSRYGECVVRANPTAAQNVLKSRPSSVAENDAMVAMSDTLASCLDKGSKLGFTKEVLRGTIALNHYRLAKAPSMTPGAVH